MTMLVTGATGKLGTKVVDALLKTVPGNKLTVSVRYPEKAEGLKAGGVDVRQGDFDRPETLETAFSNVDRLLIISADGDNDTRIRQHANAVTVAERAEVKFIAYTSIVNAKERTNLFAPTFIGFWNCNDFFSQLEKHKQTEVFNDFKKYAMKYKHHIF